MIFRRSTVRWRGRRWEQEIKMAKLAILIFIPISLCGGDCYGICKDWDKGALAFLTLLLTGAAFQCGFALCLMIFLN